MTVSSTSLIPSTLAKPICRDRLRARAGYWFRRAHPYLIFLGQLLVPLALAVDLSAYAIGNRPGGLEGVGRVMLGLGFVAYMLPIGVWAPRWLLIAPGSVIVAVAAILFVGPPLWPLLPPQGDPVTGSGLLFAAVVLAVIGARAIQGYWPDMTGAVSLTMPLGPGRYLVVQGGGDRKINHHLVVLRRHGLAALRGQAYGVDLVGWGLPHRLVQRGASDFPGFGAPVLAPCDAVVVATEDGQPDLPPGRTDRARPMGNHVWLKTDQGNDQVMVLLAHLAEGSVAVAPGEQVLAGQPVGALGNSGNTTQPHLHLHAQRPGPSDQPMVGAPVPITIVGLGALTRNRFVEVVAPERVLQKT